MAVLSGKFTVQACKESSFVPTKEDETLMNAGSAFEIASNEIYDAFINDVFGYESALDDKAFVDSITVAGNWIFKPTEMRKKLREELPLDLAGQDVKIMKQQQKDNAEEAAQE